MLSTAGHVESGQHVTQGPAIIVPDKDKRRFEYFELPNGLQALIISDPEAQKAAAALDCRVGHFSDPPEVPGLAHFCEHMLFLGTKKYPKEGEYKEFLSKHGGRSNAYTAQEHTNYKFDVAADYLEPALDRFAEFFTHPLFTESATEREMNAVDSENKMRLQDDGRRFYQLFKYNVNPNHPMAKFGSGNLQTLLHTPQTTGVDVRQQLLQFHANHYSANVMRACVVGKEPLDVLRCMVADKFSGIVNLNLPVPAWDGSPFDGVNRPHEVMLKPVKEGRALALLFPVPWGGTEHWQSKPSAYWSTLIGHEGDGSLLELMKGRGWVNTLSAGGSYGAGTWSTFSISLTLTKEGAAHVDELVEMVFTYLQMLQGMEPQEWVFRERQKMAQTNFLLRSKGDGYSQTSSLANNLQYYPPEYVLAGPSTYVAWDPTLVREFGTFLRPDNLMLYVTSSDLVEKELESREPWFGTAFTRRGVSTERMEKWLQPRRWAELHFPAPNLFIPEDLRILPMAEGQDPFPTEVPGPETWGSLCRLWHRQDDKFLEPRVVLCVDMVSGAVQEGGIRGHILSFLFDNLVNDDLGKHTYPASVAGLGFSFSKHTAGIQLQVAGYNDKLQALLETVLQSVTKDYSSSDDRFQVLKERYARALRNATKDAPLSHADRAADAALTSENFAYDAQLAVLDTLGVADVVRWAEAFFQGVTLRVFAHGNITAEGAVELLDSAVVASLRAPLGRGEIFTPLSRGVPTSPRGRIALPASVAPGAVYRRQRVRLTPATEAVVRLTVPNAEDMNSATIMYFQVGQSDLEQDARVDVLVQLMQPLFFQKLRTEQQVGYLVFCSTTRDYYTTGVQFRIQSNTLHPHEIRARILAFLPVFEEYLRNLSDSDVQRTLVATAQKWSEDDKMLAEESMRYWAEILSEHYLWERRKVAVEVLLAITKADLLDLYRRTFLDPQSLAALTSLCHSHRYPMDTATPLAAQLQASARWPGVTTQEVADPAVFRETQPLFAPWAPPFAATESPTANAAGRA